MELTVRDLGRMAYREAWALQKRVVEARRQGSGPDTLLVVEHESVVTVGRGMQGSAPAGALDVVEVERGGQATWHGPGQIVVYPIVKLAEGRRDLHAYLRALEQALIDALAGHGLGAGRRDGATGVWIDGARKIASLGVAADRWVTYHGLALNHETDLSGFAAISPCGFDASVMTSVRAELGRGAPGRGRLVGTLVEQLAAALAPFREAGA